MMDHEFIYFKSIFFSKRFSILLSYPSFIDKMLQKFHFLPCMFLYGALVKILLFATSHYAIKHVIWYHLQLD
jgi:hypothetical protein